jgi:diguanylate cyclase (GGDEF)-like protein
MGPGELITPQALALGLGLAALAYVLGGRPAAARLRELGLACSRHERRATEYQRRAEDLQKRCEAAEQQVGRLQRSIAEMPEIAQRLSATRDLREIPERALDLVDEIFAPTYSVFYRAGRQGLVAVACRGTSEFGVGHRVRPGEGIVGWSAVKQLPYTQEDAEAESGVIKAQHLAKGVPQGGFSLCLPIVSGETTLGAILIGPSPRSLPHQREIGRTIALISAVCITSAVVLKQQRLLAKTDGLTGLLNKRHLLERIGDLLASEEGGPRLVSVFLFDLDHFKHYNDSNGHQPGDELLQALGELLLENIREADLLGRFGGEEFLLVMPEVEKTEALRAADRLRQRIAQHPFPFREGQPGGRVTVSGGLASWPADADGVQNLIRCADQALYAAKRQGRNRVVAFAPAELVTGPGDPLADDAKPPDDDFS